MRGTRHTGRERHQDAAFARRPRHDGTPVRKRRMLRAAVTVAAAGAAVTLPIGSQALAQLNPVVLKRLGLDSATLSRVKAYDRYRTREARQRERARTALTFARRQVGKPYRWGAAGPSGYDCSGLAMASWRRAGVTLPRVTYSQYASVKRKVRLRHLRPGDLIFFHGRSHVGIYLGHGRYLHAPYTGARIRVDRLDRGRRRQFAGAVRPGAPAYRKWSPSIRELVDKIDRMGAKRDAAKQRPPDTDAQPKSDAMDFDMPMAFRKNRPSHSSPRSPGKALAPGSDGRTLQKPKHGPARGRSGPDEPEQGRQHDQEQGQEHSQEHGRQPRLENSRVRENSPAHAREHADERVQEQGQELRWEHGSVRGSVTDPDHDPAPASGRDNEAPAEPDTGSRVWTTLAEPSPSGDG
ncbi:C40 family peptidase [Actinomadura roseirufa]|uniref:C40 family peptidase n=1 Tax=Actinomadura roseirufa TaxID=2094049 RepID=UPI001040F6EA|nr:C40 family peptidase [Actinomadura roseirufa]